MKGKILIVDDDDSMCGLLQEYFESLGMTVSVRSSGTLALDLLSRESFDIVLTDLKMPKVSGLAVCEYVMENQPHVPVIVLTAFGSLDTAVQAIRVGAFDFVTKPIDLGTLRDTVERALRTLSTREIVKRREQLEEPTDIVVRTLRGESGALKTLRHRVHEAQRSLRAVLVLGEAGTGKTMVSRILTSKKAGSVPEIDGKRRQAEREIEDMAAVCRRAKGLPEHVTIRRVDELSLTALRTLIRLAGAGHFEVDKGGTRLILTRRIPIKDEVEKEFLLNELFLVLGPLELFVPPLREREADILILANSFIGSSALAARKGVRGLTEAAGFKLLNYEWPGNVQQLKNVIEHAITVTRTESVVVEDLPLDVRQYKDIEPIRSVIQEDTLMSMEEVEERYILHVLRTLKGNKLHASRILGLDRRTLYRKLDKLRSS